MCIVKKAWPEVGARPLSSFGVVHGMQGRQATIARIALDLPSYLGITALYGKGKKEEKKR